MTANVGRTTIVRRGTGTPQPIVAGVREKGLNTNGEAVDITNDDSGGWRTLLNAAGVNSVDIPVSGVADDDTLRQEWFSNDRLKPTTFEYPDGGTVTGDFYLQGYSETGAHDGEVTFEATFMSSGPAIYTPAA